VLCQQKKVTTQGSGFRVQESTRTSATLLDFLRHVRIGPAAISPRQLLLS
jgi:hypothetical protein